MGAGASAYQQRRIETWTSQEVSEAVSSLGPLYKNISSTILNFQIDGTALCGMVDRNELDFKELGLDSKIQQNVLISKVQSLRELDNCASGGREIHLPHSVDETVPPQDQIHEPKKDGFPFVKPRRAFASLRFDGVVTKYAKKVQTALAERGVDLRIVDIIPGRDIDTEVFSGIEEAEAFIVFGSSNYGEDTGNPASTFHELKYAQECKKQIIMIRMIPFEQKHEHLPARVLFGQNKLTLFWLLNTPMPPTLVDDIMKGMSQPGGATSNKTPELVAEEAVPVPVAEVEKAIPEPVADEAVPEPVAKVEKPKVIPGAASSFSSEKPKQSRKELEKEKAALVKATDKAAVMRARMIHRARMRASH